ncbi:MFS transporter [Paenibacillus alginolyticus]|uniref:MFS transporter n=1 Tax=Paenibacillus alginolyticus TaxID=59839 RepID=A0ABT4GC12_9BACL|nr:MFS transporter [Paenibacillus alginolyticus]MCY9667440.1 MFS transporter [Paenibacillus alginolyticus]MCY9693711.1 MFS transporter [Paenibacillus alginolyticus]MEC0144576.1 MFS transporter [Paenibacillus alginolyticus]
MTNLLREWKSQFHGYSRNILLFFWFNFVWNLGLGMFGLVYNLYVRSLGYDQTTVGSMVGMASLAAAIILIPAGLMNDRFGPKRVITFGLIFTIVALTSRSLIEVKEGMLISSFLGGMALSVVSATILPFMANNSTPQQRVHLFSFNMALVMLANVVGIALGGVLSDLFQFIIGLDEIRSLRFTLLIGVGIATLGFIPIAFFEKSEQEIQPRGESLKWKQVWSVHKPSLQVIGIFCLLGLLSSIGGGMIVPYLNVYFEDRFDASKSAIGIVVALGQAATAIAFLIGPMIVKRFGEVKSVVYLQLCSIPFLLLTAFSANFYLSSGGYLFRQALMNAANPFYNSIKMSYVNRSLRGLASSSGEAVFNLGWFLASPISTGLVFRYGSYYGYAYAFCITAVVYTVISYLFYFFFGKNRFKPVEESA